MHSWASALERLHEYLSFATSATRQLRHLWHAVLVWLQVEHESKSSSSLGLKPVIDGGCLTCPCCWRNCTALSLDACLGLRYMFQHYLHISYSHWWTGWVVLFILHFDVKKTVTYTSGTLHYTSRYTAPLAVCLNGFAVNFWLEGRATFPFISDASYCSQATQERCNHVSWFGGFDEGLAVHRSKWSYFRAAGSWRC